MSLESFLDFLILVLVDFLLYTVCSGFVLGLCTIMAIKENNMLYLLVWLIPLVMAVLDAWDEIEDP
ncbi:hypothetical protein DRN86_00010 [Candidatus Geothermarchaeota archaeon]|nr:MAG: hypothetical protein DRN86_00010 [Candidatus Geothermarchaeota archaeon]